MSLAVLFSFIAMLLWASSNMLDKILLSKYGGANSVYILMIYSGLIGFVTTPLYFLFDTSALSVTPLEALSYIFAGFLYIATIFFYLLALKDDDASSVVPFFQLIPVFVLIMAYFILGEALSLNQILASLGIVVGGAILSFEWKRARFKTHLVVLIVTSCFLAAFYEVFFKYFALSDGFFVVSFWSNVALILTSVFLLSIKSVRYAFVCYAQECGKKMLALNSVNEVINSLGYGFFTYALLLAPAALVALTSTYQAGIVFLIGLLLTHFFPRILKEDISKQVLIQKGVAIAVIALSSYFLFF